MEHLQPFVERTVLSLPSANDHGWHIKRYAILANGREYDNNIAASALIAAWANLPVASTLDDSTGNHGIGFQLVHFAEVAVVSPVFYWQWGSVLANAGQMRASWDAPTLFTAGVEEVVGCIWEMQIVGFEINAWKNTLLNNVGTPAERLIDYFEQRFV